MVESISIRNNPIVGMKSKFDFINGINTIVGANGSGKSFLLKTIATNGFVDNIGSTKIPFVLDKSPIEYLSGKSPSVDFKWDGKGVFYLSEEYFRDSHRNLAYEMSSGQLIKGFPRFMDMRLNNVSSGNITLSHLEYLLEVDPTDFNENPVEPYWGSYGEWESFIGKFSFNGKPTMLLDEIDSRLDLFQQHRFHHEFIPKLSERFQVIMTSHSPWVKTEDVNLIDLDGTFSCNIEILKLFLK